MFTRKFLEAPVEVSSKSINFSTSRKRNPEALHCMYRNRLSGKFDKGCPRYLRKMLWFPPSKSWSKVLNDLIEGFLSWVGITKRKPQTFKIMCTFMHVKSRTHIALEIFLWILAKVDTTLINIDQLIRPPTKQRKIYFIWHVALSKAWQKSVKSSTNIKWEIEGLFLQILISCKWLRFSALTNNRKRTW